MIYSSLFIFLNFISRSICSQHANNRFSWTRRWWGEVSCPGSRKLNHWYVHLPFFFFISSFFDSKVPNSSFHSWIVLLVLILSLQQHGCKMQVTGQPCMENTWINTLVVSLILPFHFASSVFPPPCHHKTNAFFDVLLIILGYRQAGMIGKWLSWHHIFPFSHSFV